MRLQEFDFQREIVKEKLLFLCLSFSCKKIILNKLCVASFVSRELFRSYMQLYLWVIVGMTCKDVSRMGQS
jgi:hypothetical protein